MRKWVRRISYVFLTVLLLVLLGGFTYDRSEERGMPVNCLHELDRRSISVDAL